MQPWWDLKLPKKLSWISLDTSRGHQPFYKMITSYMLERAICILVEMHTDIEKQGVSTLALSHQECGEKRS